MVQLEFSDSLALRRHSLDIVSTRASIHVWLAAGRDLAATSAARLLRPLLAHATSVMSRRDLEERPMTDPKSCYILRHSTTAIESAALDYDVGKSELLERTNDA